MNMRSTLLVCLLAILASCQSLQRLARVSPLSGEVAEDRVNLWPLYYENHEEVAILWPIYDQDAEGFALRPILTRDGSDWEVFPPIAWWNTETGNWVVVPAYSIGDSSGLFPVVGFGDFNFVGPAWWTKDEEDGAPSYGLFPLFTISPGLNWAALAWWDKDKDGEVESWGVFPIASKSERFNQVGPVVWGYDENGDKDYFTVFPLYGYGTLDDGRRVNWAGPAWWLDGEDETESGWGLFPLAMNLGTFHQAGPVFWAETDDGDTDYLVAFPLYGYGRREDGGGVFVSLLGAKGWDAEGQTEFLNILWLLYHRSQSETSASTNILLPFVNWAHDENESSWRLWPLFGHSEGRTPGTAPEADATADSQASAQAEDWSKDWALMGLYERKTSTNKTGSVRLAPLFSYKAEGTGQQTLFDALSLVSFQRTAEDTSELHVGTPLVFNYYEESEGHSWNALLGALDYETDGNGSSFDLLYYLYRSHTTGTETRRDIFPFITWDSGREHAKFSFLHRLFNYERDGERTGGHILFIPWGDV